jgi:protein SCO1/2
VRFVAVLLAFLLAACSSSGGGAKTSTSNLNDQINSSGKFAGLGLEPAQPRPSFTLTDDTGKPFSFSQTSGHPTFLFFGYTNCPDVCPTTFADIAVALRKLDPSVAAQVQVVFVTTDPARDTPRVIRTWLDRFDADLPTQFVGLTGDQATLDQAQLSAGVPLAEDNGQTHSALLLLYGADDVAHVAFDAGNTPKDIESDLSKVAAGS